MQDGPFSDLHKAGVLALCMHLTEKGLSLPEAVWTARQSKSGFSFLLMGWDECTVNTSTSPNQLNLVH